MNKTSKKSYADWLLEEKIQDVELDVRKDFFNGFARHYNVTEDKKESARKTFEKLCTLDVTLGLALSTAFALA